MTEWLPDWLNEYINHVKWNYDLMEEAVREDIRGIPGKHLCE